MPAPSLPTLENLSPPPLSHLMPHHIGVATQSIESELPIFKALGFEIEGEFIDQVQGIRGLFITSKAMSPSHYKFPYRLELLENLPQSTRLDNYLKNHHKLYHIAFVSHDIQSDAKAILDARFTQSTDFTRGGGTGGKSPRARMLVPIIEASYFSKLCFIMLPNRLLIELVELNPHHLYKKG